MRGLNAEYERRARFWMRAFPARFNAAHADEMLGTLADDAGPNATRLHWGIGSIWSARVRGSDCGTGHRPASGCDTN